MTTIFFHFLRLKVADQYCHSVIMSYAYLFSISSNGTSLETYHVIVLHSSLFHLDFTSTLIKYMSTKYQHL